MDDRINRLPKAVRSLIRTGVAITSVAQCVEELVTNALDAGATCLAIRVDLTCFKIQVVDNGKGIKLEDLPLVGERYATSKCHEVSDLENLCYFGYRGEAVASLRDISNIIEINTRSKSSTLTYCKIFQQGKALPISESTLPRSCAGTTITVHDLFFNLPVRKKCCNPTIEFEKIRQKVENIALIKPSVSFTLRNDATGHVVLQTHKTNSVLNTFNYLFSPEVGVGLSEISGQEGDFIVDGYISKKGASKKDYQFIYINNRTVLKTKLHKVVNQQLSKSLILRKKLELTTNKFRGHVMSTSPTKTTDQHAVYVLNVTCPYKEYDITFEPAKTLVEFRNFEVLQQCLEKTISKFLVEHSLHLGILAEDFQNRSKCNDREENNKDDGQQFGAHRTENVGLSPKFEITTSDRNGLFSKVVKRKIILDPKPQSVETIDNVTSNDDYQETGTEETPKEAESSSVKSFSTQSDLQLVVNTPSTPSGQQLLSETPSALSEQQMRSKTPSTSSNKQLISESESETPLTPSDQQLKAKTPFTPLPKFHKIGKMDTASSSVESNNDAVSTSESESKNYKNKKDHEDEMSEEPLPCQQRGKTTGSMKKKIICLETPSTKDAKLNMSSLSKLRALKFMEECPYASMAPKNSNRLATFTKIRESMTSSKEPEKIGLITRKQESIIQKGYNSSPKPYISTLQKLRNLRNSGEHNKKMNEHSVVKTSLKELRKIRTEIPDKKCHKEKSMVHQCSKSTETVCETHDGSCSTFPKTADETSGTKSSTGTKTACETPSSHENMTLSQSREDLPSVVHCSEDETQTHDNLRTFNDNQTCLVKGTNQNMDWMTMTNESLTESSESSLKFQSRLSNATDSPEIGETDLPSSIKEDSENGQTCPTSSPVDIDGVCDAIDSCVTEIENIITDNKVKNKVLVSAQTSTSDIEYGTPGPIKIYDVHNLKQPRTFMPPAAKKARMFMTSDDLVHVAKSYRSVEEPWMDTEQPQVDVSNRLENKNASEAGTKCPSNQLDNNVTFMSYFDVNETQNTDVSMATAANPGYRNDKKLPFDYYMEQIRKKTTYTDNEENDVDQSLVCMESINDVDDYDHHYSPTQEFSVSRSCDLLIDCRDINTIDLDIDYHNGAKCSLSEFRPRSVSICSSEGFCPEKESEGFFPTVTDVLPFGERETTGSFVMSPSGEKESDIVMSQSGDKKTDFVTLSGEKVINVDVLPSGDKETFQDFCNTVTMDTEFHNSKQLTLSQKLRISMECNKNLTFPSSNSSGSTNTNKTYAGHNVLDIGNEINTPHGSKTYRQSADLGNHFDIPDSSQTYDNSADLFSDNLHTSNSQVFNLNSTQNDHVSTKESSTNRRTFFEDIFSQCHFHRNSESVSVQEQCGQRSNECINSNNAMQKNSLQKTPDQIKCDEMSLNVFSPEGDLVLAGNCCQSSTSNVECPASDCSSNRNDKECFSPDGDSELRRVGIDDQTWIKVMDPKSGEPLYINARSGHSVTSADLIPSEEDVSNSKDVPDLTTPVTLRRKSLSLSPDSSRSIRVMLVDQLSKDEDDLSSVKWKEKTNNTQRVEDLLNDWENPVFTIPHKDLPNVQVNLMSRASSKAFKALNPCVFDKDMLQSFKVSKGKTNIYNFLMLLPQGSGLYISPSLVLGQVDNKFIACSLHSVDQVGEQMLVLIDQHAAHERIRLEKLTQDVYELQNDIKVISSTDLAAPEIIELPEDIIRVVASYTEEFNLIGIRFSWEKKSRDSITLLSVPSCFIQRDADDNKRKKETGAIKSAKTLIKEYTEVLLDTKGSRGRLPNTIHKALCSQACHGAIKFGDALTLEECEDLLKDLTKCNLPFQCAHGRPSVVPLIQLKGKSQVRMDRLYMMKRIEQENRDYILLRTSDEVYHT